MPLPKQEIVWWKCTLNYRENESIDVNIKRFTITKLKTTVIKEFAEERGMTFVKLNLGELEEVGD